MKRERQRRELDKKLGAKVRIYHRKERVWRDSILEHNPHLRIFTDRYHRLQSMLEVAAVALIKR